MTYESDCTDDKLSMGYQRTVDEIGGHSEMVRWIQRQALCSLGSRWWRRSLDVITAAVLGDTPAIDLADQLLTNADFDSFNDLVDKAIVAAKTSCQMGAEEDSSGHEFSCGDDVNHPIESHREGSSDEDDICAPSVPEGAEATDNTAAAAQRPSLAMYQEKWAKAEAYHARAPGGIQSRSILVPEPIPQLWQNAPHVPFDRLKSSAAAARLSVCRPQCDLRAAHPDGGGTYAHITGDVIFRRRAPLQLASTMGFVLNKREGRFMGLTEEETADVHECLTWGRQLGNNRHLWRAATVYEAYLNSADVLLSSFDTVIPEGCPRVKIQMTRRDRCRVQEMLPETLGRESVGLVIIDPNPTGLRAPMSYEQLGLMEHVSALGGDCQLQLSVPGPDGRGWQRAQASVIPRESRELGSQWAHSCAENTRPLAEETRVRINHPHYDAQVFVTKHPYGTGSLLSERGSGSIQAHARNRLCLIESQFRKDPLWGFFQLDRLHKSQLFFGKKRREANRSVEKNEKDPYKRLYGVNQPRDIPETAEWWETHQKNLSVITEPAEHGMFQVMVTLSHNDSSAEMLAVVRRGPGARPTSVEQLEYLMTSKPASQGRPVVEEYALEHVLSFQRRTAEFKKWFLRRGEVTPLGMTKDWWDRTEAQQRAALHSHIPTWFVKRAFADRDPDYRRLASIPREAPGHRSRQRPTSQQVLPLRPYQEDHIYHSHQVGRVNAQMVRPTWNRMNGGKQSGGDDLAKLRVSRLARAIQTKLYLHNCGRRYCLKDRSSCRFFYPWPCQPQQQYDENTDRVALERQVVDDDQWVVPHNLCVAMFSPSTVNILPFDPEQGIDQARQYAGKYAAKPEQHYYLETTEDSVKFFLKARTVGLCMAYNRLMGFRVVQTRISVKFFHTEFLPANAGRSERTAKDKQQYPDYPHPQHYLNSTQKYFHRSESLRHLRLEQFHRYFSYTKANENPDDDHTPGLAGEDYQAPEEQFHRHFDDVAQSVRPGTRFQSHHHKLHCSSGACRCNMPSARRRPEARLGVARFASFELNGEQREKFYEQRLLLTLPWYIVD